MTQPFVPDERCLWHVEMDAKYQDTWINKEVAIIFKALEATKPGQNGSESTTLIFV